MHTSEPATARTEGEALLRRLFETGAKRLRERGVELQYSPAVLSGMLDQPDWQSSLNPLRTLSGLFHQQVASVIEDLLLERRLRPGHALSLLPGEAPAVQPIRFDVEPQR